MAMSVSEPGHGLLPAPAGVLLADGSPAFGGYAGNIGAVEWNGLSGAFKRSSLWQRLHHKRWQYVGIAGAECFIGLAIVDAGWAASAFAYLFDREQRRVLVDFSAMGIPGVSVKVNQHGGAGAFARFKGPGGEIMLARPPGSTAFALKLDIRGLRIDAELDAAPAAPTLSAVIPIQNGVANCTQKSACLRVSGLAECLDKRFDLHGYSASLDYTNGLLARHTAWRWASAHCPQLGFNLQSGFNGAHENILWLNGRMVPLGAAQFDFDPKRPMQPWHVATDDGLLDLTFEPHGARRENKNLLIAASDYIQPIGVFSGQVRASRHDAPTIVTNLLGVTEDHRARW